MTRTNTILFLLLLLVSVSVRAQEQSFVIREVKVVGAAGMEERSVISMSGLYTGVRIKDGDGKIAAAIRKLWKLDVFEHVNVYVKKDEPEIVVIDVKTSPRLKELLWKNLSNKEMGQLSAKVGLIKGGRLTPGVRKKTKARVISYFENKGYHGTKVKLEWEEVDAHADLVMTVQKGRKLKVKEVELIGNEAYTSKDLRKSLKPYAKRLGLFKPAYDDDIDKEVQEKLQEHYASAGYADFEIAKPEISIDNEGDVSIKLSIVEGEKYYLGNITWEGNSKYSDEQLTTLTGLKKGMVFDPASLEQSLRFKPDGSDVSSLYMDQGHLFFTINC